MRIPGSSRRGLGLIADNFGEIGKIPGPGWTGCASTIYMDAHGQKLANPFTAHPKRQGISYWAHLCFAVGIACRLLRSVVFFALHGIFPFIGIARELDLEATSAYLNERNRWIESAHDQTDEYPESGFTEQPGSDEALAA